MKEGKEEEAPLFGQKNEFWVSNLDNSLAFLLYLILYRHHLISI